MAKIDIRKNIKFKKDNREIEAFEEGKSDNAGAFKRAASSIMKDVLEASNKHLREVGEKDFHVNKVINTTFVQNLSALGMNLQMISGIFGISDRQLRNIFKEKPELQSAYYQGRTLAGINYLGIANEKIETNEDSNNKILMTMLAETTGISEKRVNVLENNIQEEDKIDKEELKNDILKSLTFKVNKATRENEAVDADFTEVKQEEDK